MNTERIGTSVLLLVVSLLLLNNAAAQESPSRAEVEAEERSIVRKITTNGAGSRLVIPGVATKNVPPSALTIKSATALYWSLEMELPSDTIYVRNMKPSIYGNGSIHRFDGEVRFDNAKKAVVVGEGDERNRLTFVLLSDIGYIYVRGEGKVVFPDGRTVELGHGDNVQRPAPSTTASPHPCSDISWVQKHLSELGHDPGPVDGVWGPKSRKALEAFQVAAGVGISGELDDQTCAKLR